MGRLVSAIGGLVAVARLAVDAAAVWRDLRKGREAPESGGGGDRERPDQPKPPDQGAAGPEGGSGGGA